ncbi:hypothetical protein [Rossellomorea sp. y25]|uniref:hypothetical protein n=1 Tax=Rossellomorea sp. y25 TaxID=3118174 RepID=UPI0030E3469C
MPKLRIVTHNSGEFETEVDSFDPVEMNEQLNSMEVNTVVIGDLILSKIDVKVISPIKEI